MKTDFDILIVGGGLVGLTVALACGQAGFRIGVVDIEKPSEQLAESHDGRASAIATASFRMMRALGVADALVEGDDTHAGPINKILVSDGQAGAAPSPLTLFFDSAQIAEANDGEPLGYMVENRRMRHALHGQTKKQDNITWIAPARVSDIETSGAKTTITFEDGKSLSASLLVAADGRNSFVRRKAGIGVTSWPCHQKAIVTTVEHELPHEGIAHELFLPAGPFAILPLTGNRASIVWTERPRAADAAMALDTEKFAAELARRFGDFLGWVKPVAPRWCYPLSFQHANTYVGERLVLVGDAAHAIHPIAGQGFNMGLRDAAALAEILVQARAEGRDLGDAFVLAQFESWRKFDNTALTLACDMFNRLFSNNIAPIKHARRMGLDIVDKLPPVRAFFMKEASGQIGDLPPLLRGEAYI
ncbi:UbiH/UbiF/VisC/COQ6 family ubiquinone biosynthesis hydroxylase [bacterium AH-315-J19]|nr:UbiH/UbiF/VisC/COQ6 family ubiquinone biosynthesis hydroxylase [Robiginitomaculum sp.]MBN4058471.1 UbiH/UbiF/VisC/COQ6 family ubiquinone biosynthesis hydroxylase [bacterium AH-315-J19]